MEKKKKDEKKGKMGEKGMMIMDGWMDGWRNGGMEL